MSDWDRFNSQFRETEHERNSRLKKLRLERNKEQGISDLPPKDHNNPPKTVFETIDGLCLEAMHWLDGKPIETDEQAAGLGKLMDMLAAARKECEAERKEKVAPIDEAKKAIQAVYVPVLKKADDALGVAQTVRNRYLKAKQAVLDEQVRIAREEAAEALRIAQEAMRERTGSLADAQAAEALAEMARSAEINARIAAKATPAKIGGRKTVSKAWTATLVNLLDALRHYYQTRPADLSEYVTGLANTDVRHTGKYIPGFTTTEVE